MDKPAGADGAVRLSLQRFIAERVAPLSRAFAQTPLARLRLRTPDGSITLVKSSQKLPLAAPAKAAALELRTFPLRDGSGEPGRPYDTINAEVVGIFHAAPDLPAPGDRIEADVQLGYIEALKLENPVRSGGPCVFVGQVADEGQPVDFGETLFVVDRNVAPPAQTAQPAEEVEPPRI